MMVLHVRGLQKEYQGTPILTDITFHLAGRERLALVGANGCGKSTLLKILAGELPADGGLIDWITPGLSRAYLCQEGHWDPDLPLQAQLEQVPADLLSRCGIAGEMLDRPAGSLSGGQKVRAALARVLATRPDVLLLDEPTNHLDAAGLAWLEALLQSYPGTILLVSHDRWFLDRVTTRTLELAGGSVKEYGGNYSVYAEEKRREFERQQGEYAQYQRKKKQLEATIRDLNQQAASGSTNTIRVASDLPWTSKGYYAAKGAAAGARAKSLEKRLAKMKVEKPREATQVNLKLQGEGKLARHLILGENLGFTYDGANWLLRNAVFAVERGERVALVGPNGAGKSTLLKLVLGQLAPSAGRLQVPPLRIAYLDQEMADLNPEETVLVAATGNAAADQAEARTLLGCLLFSREDVFKQVQMLSGGEKVRLAIAKILLAGPDLLVLDEPTNNLDLPSRERVEEALADYPGTMLLVSHDRYLLQRVATKVISLADGRLQTFLGGYAEYQARQSRDATAAPGGPAGGGAVGASGGASGGATGSGGLVPGEDLAAKRLLLETRLAQLSAALAVPAQPKKRVGRQQPPVDMAALHAEFMAVSRELRALKDAAGVR